MSNAERQARRQAALDEAAQRAGYETWRKLETAVVNQRAIMTLHTRGQDQAATRLIEAAEMENLSQMIEAAERAYYGMQTDIAFGGTPDEDWLYQLSQAIGHASERLRYDDNEAFVESIRADLAQALRRLATALSEARLRNDA